MKVYSIFPKVSRTEASPSDGLVSYPGHLSGIVLPLCGDAIGVFYSQQHSHQILLIKGLLRNYSQPFFNGMKW